MTEQFQEPPPEDEASQAPAERALTPEAVRLELVDYLNHYGRLLAEAKENGVVDTDIRPVVHELPGAILDPRQDPLDALASARQVYVEAMNDPRFHEESGLLPEPLDVPLGPDSLPRAITKFGSVGALVEAIYKDSNGNPIELRPQLWVPSAAADEYIGKELRRV